MVYLSLKLMILSLAIAFAASTKKWVCSVGRRGCSVVDLARLIVLWCLGASVMGERAPSQSIRIPVQVLVGTQEPQKREGLHTFFPVAQLELSPVAKRTSASSILVITCRPSTAALPHCGYHDGWILRVIVITLF